MTKSQLASWYRQATRDRDAAALPDADALVALAQGARPADAEQLVTGIAQSALQADLLHFARALEPASAALSAELAQTFGEQRAAASHPHRRRAAASRVAAGYRRAWPVALTGVAAALLVALGVWSQRAPHEAQTASRSAPPDRIFAARDQREPHHADVIFRADFRGDEIFHARFSGG